MIGAYLESLLWVSSQDWEWKNLEYPQILLPLTTLNKTEKPPDALIPTHWGHTLSPGLPFSTCSTLGDTLSASPAASLKSASRDESRTMLGPPGSAFAFLLKGKGELVQPCVPVVPRGPSARRCSSGCTVGSKLTCRGWRNRTCGLITSSELLTSGLLPPQRGSFSC